MIIKVKEKHEAVSKLLEQTYQGNWELRLPHVGQQIDSANMKLLEIIEAMCADVEYLRKKSERPEKIVGFQIVTESYGQDYIWAMTDQGRLLRKHRNDCWNYDYPLWGLN